MKRPLFISFLIFTFCFLTVPVALSEEPVSEDIKFCVYHFKDSIDAYIYGFENLIEKPYNFTIGRHFEKSSEYPIYMTVKAYGEGVSVERNIIMFVPVTTERFGQSVGKDRTFMVFSFPKVVAPDDIVQKHLKAVQDFTFTVPHSEYDMYLVPEVLSKRDGEGELVFEFKETHSLRGVPKMIVPKKKE